MQPVLRPGQLYTTMTYVMRVVADHVRSSLMLIGDGVRPGNDGRYMRCAA